MLIIAWDMEDWRTRLIQAVDADGRSDRAISEASGLGVNFVNELRKGEKEPGVNKVIKLAATLNLSLGFVFNGAEISARDEADLKVFLSLSPENRQSILSLARQLVTAERA
jgi:transcriptional regulator with XRE-family HTH domain